MELPRYSGGFTKVGALSLDKDLIFSVLLCLQDNCIRYPGH